MRVLLTGATGYVGRHLAARLLTAGHAVRALVRGADAESRLRAALAPSLGPGAEAAMRHLRVVAGDVTLAGCGIDRHACAWQPEAVVHCAGLTRFEARAAEALTVQNVQGTQHVHALARSLGARTFHHVSTAFVAGRSTHPFGPEDFDRAQAFHNPYEASKFAAEAWLRAQGGDGPAVVIHRPSIVVGGQPLGASTSVSTLYAFMKALHFVRECCLRERARGGGRLAALGAVPRGDCLALPLRVAADPAVTIDLVDVQDVADGILAALSAPPVRAVRTAQLTGRAFPLAEIARGMMRGLSVEGVRLVPADDFDVAPPNALEASFARSTRVYRPYLFESVRFRGSAITAPRVPDLEQLTRAFLAALAARREAGQEDVGHLALETLAIRTPADYFAGLGEGTVGRVFLARHDYVDAVIAFRLLGRHPCDVTLRFAAGTVRADTTPEATPDCRYELDSDLFMQVVAGTRDLRAAFLRGQVRITGDRELALKFGTLLGRYYQHIDTHVVEELTA
ncbi:MAG: SDR family oxidoreductase [Gammaproteobacteria bacterium]